MKNIDFFYKAGKTWNIGNTPHDNEKNIANKFYSDKNCYDTFTREVIFTPSEKAHG
jgi:hypothetical protein